MQNCQKELFFFWGRGGVEIGQEDGRLRKATRGPWWPWFFSPENHMNQEYSSYLTLA